MLPSELSDCDKAPVQLSQPAFENRELIDIAHYVSGSS